MGTVVAINECTFGSTGTIAKTILSFCKEKGHLTYLCAFEGRHSDTFFPITGGKVSDFINRALCRVAGGDGFYNFRATHRLILFLNKVKPQVITLHNVHGRYINLPLLLRYAKQNDVRVFWTLHDCWAFTGRCPHFVCEGCFRWKEKCGHCPSRKKYPAAYLLDGSSHYLRKKARLINGMKDNLVLVTPSKWLFDYLAVSHLNGVERVLIHNGILPPPLFTEAEKDLKRKALGLSGKKVLLAAAFGFNPRKGYDYINRLAEELDPSKFAIVVAGVKDKVHASSKLSKNIISVGFIADRRDMNLLYSVADAFVNPTLEDNFPTVNIEALMNGCPVITFKTGGSPEAIDSETGIIVEREDYPGLFRAVHEICSRNIDREKCRARGLRFTDTIMCANYYDLFKDSLGASSAHKTKNG